MLLVIDRQQRLTTLLLTNICLHQEIRRRGARFEKEETAFRWLYRQTIEVNAQLQETFEEDRKWGDGVYQWYPRMIRAYVDSWSRSKDHARYKSPIAAFIHGYSDHIRGDNRNSQYTGEIEQIDKNDPLLIHYRTIQQKLRIVSNGGDQDLEIPPLKTIAGNPKFQGYMSATV